MHREFFFSCDKSVLSFSPYVVYISSMNTIAIVTRLSRTDTDVEAIYHSIAENFYSFKWLVYVEHGHTTVPEVLATIAQVDPRVIINNELTRDGAKDVYFTAAVRHAFNTEVARESRWLYVLDDDNIVHSNLRGIVDAAPEVDLVVSDLNDRRGVHCIDKPRNLTANNCIGRTDYASVLCSPKFFHDHIHDINTQTKASDGELVQSYLRHGARVWYSERVGGYYNHLQFYPKSKLVDDIAIVTLDNRPELPWVTLSNYSKEQYCLRYGFDFIFKDTLYYKDRHPVWSKLPCMLEVLPQYEYAVWLDSDAIIANPRIDLSVLLDSRDVYYSRDFFGINFGVFAVKNTPIGKAFLEDVDRLYAKYDKITFREQAAAAFLISGKYKSQSKEVPARCWNSYDDTYSHKTLSVYQDGDLILHLPSKDDEYRLNRFSEILGYR